jgi:hypothetical protein
LSLHSVLLPEREAKPAQCWSLSKFQRTIPQNMNSFEKTQPLIQAKTVSMLGGRPKFWARFLQLKWDMNKRIKFSGYTSHAYRYSLCNHCHQENQHKRQLSNYPLSAKMEFHQNSTSSAIQKN